MGQDAPARMRYALAFIMALMALAALAAAGCTGSGEGLPDEKQIVMESELYRTNLGSYMKEHPSSPFNSGTPRPYNELRWYPVDPDYYFLAELIRYPDPETVAVAGTGGETRRQLRYGYFSVDLDGEETKLNVYKFTDSDIRRHPSLARNLSVWFTDETTGNETYPVGRYLEIEPENADPGHRYIVNLNNSHNPFCAYNPEFSCAIPTKEDRIASAVRVGEMNYPDSH